MTRYEILIQGLQRLRDKLDCCKSSRHYCHSCHYLSGLIQGYIDTANLLGEEGSVAVGKAEATKGYAGRGSTTHYD